MNYYIIYCETKNVTREEIDLYSRLSSCHGQVDPSIHAKKQSMLLQIMMLMCLVGFTNTNKQKNSRQNNSFKQESKSKPNILM